MNVANGSMLSIGTSREGLVFSILIRAYTLNCRPAEFYAEVIIANPNGKVIGTFELDGNEDWSLRNACEKRIATGDYDGYENREV